MQDQTSRFSIKIFYFVQHKWIISRDDSERHFKTGPEPDRNLNFVPKTGPDNIYQGCRRFVFSKTVKR